MTKNGQYLQVVNHLEAMIASGNLAPGDKIPSLRQLGQQFELSTGTVRRSVDFLREKGTLTIYPGSGAYVSKKKNNQVAGADGSGGKYRITVFLTTDNLSNCYCAHALQGIQSAVGTQCSLILHFHDYYHDYYHNATLELPLLEDAAAESDALLFLGCYDYILKKLPLTKPCVGVEMHSSYNGLMSTVALDPLNAAELACDFFKNHGYKKVKILSETAEPMPVYRFRKMAFIERWSRYGEYEEICCSKQIGVEHVADKASAYFFTSDTEYNRLAVHYRDEYGKVLVNERCILSIDGKSLLAPGYEPINTIAVDWKTMGVVALEECIRRIENPGTQSRRIYQNCSLIENKN